MYFLNCDRRDRKKRFDFPSFGRAMVSGEPWRVARCNGSKSKDSSSHWPAAAGAAGQMSSKRRPSWRQRDQNNLRIIIREYFSSF